jgi:hypothetical protein
LTSSITGNAPYAPVPMISRRHFQGDILPERQLGVPKLLAKLLGGLLLALWILPRSTTTSYSWVTPVDPDATEGEIFHPHDPPSKIARARSRQRGAPLSAQ